MATLLLTRRDMKGLLDMRAVLPAIEQAFKDLAEGRASMPPKAYLLLEKGDFRAMPAAVPEAAGMKWVSVFPVNRTVGLPTVMGTLVYNDPLTGYPLAVMDATELTDFRTGATAAVAAKYLARKDSHVLGLVGAGRQARTQLLAHAELFDIREIRVYDRSSVVVHGLAQSLPDYPIKACSLEETAASDIVCTTTPAREPVLKKAMVRPGTHINAIGADAAGKEELEPAILNGAVVVVDDVRQARSSGEINVPVSRGLFRVEDIYATLAEIVSGRKPGRPDDQAVTIFDSTGVAIEDIAVAKLVYAKAREASSYRSVDLAEE